MQLPKFVLADNSDFPDDIFIIHLDFPRFLINLNIKKIKPALYNFESYKKINLNRL